MLPRSSLCRMVVEHVMQRPEVHDSFVTIKNVDYNGIEELLVDEMRRRCIEYIESKKSKIIALCQNYLMMSKDMYMSMFPNGNLQDAEILASWNFIFYCRKWHWINCFKIFFFFYQAVYPGYMGSVYGYCAQVFGEHSSTEAECLCVCWASFTFLS